MLALASAEAALALSHAAPTLGAHGLAPRTPKPHQLGSSSAYQARSALSGSALGRLPSLGSSCALVSHGGAMLSSAVAGRVWGGDIPIINKTRPPAPSCARSLVGLERACEEMMKTA